MRSAGDVSERRTICRLCAATCGMVVTVRDDRIIDVRGDPTHPAPACVRCSVRADRLG